MNKVADFFSGNPNSQQEVYVSLSRRFSTPRARAS